MAHYSNSNENDRSTHGSNNNSNTSNRSRNSHSNNLSKGNNTTIMGLRHPHLSRSQTKATQVSSVFLVVKPSKIIFLI